jgi:hypothetical protein
LLAELRKSLDKAHDITCGPNDIHYQLVLSRDDIWETSDLPSIWKLANVIPIPKSGKDKNDRLYSSKFFDLKLYFLFFFFLRFNFFYR